MAGSRIPGMYAGNAPSGRSRSARPNAALLLLLLGLTALFAALPSIASAAEYEVEVCTPASPAGDGIAITQAATPPLYFEPCGTAMVGGIVQGTTGGIVPEGSSQSWTLSAPANTRIHTLELTSSFAPGGSFLDWVLSTSAGSTLIGPVIDDGRPSIPPPERKKYTVDAASVTGRLFCPSFMIRVCPGTAANSFAVTLADIDATLEDAVPPSVAVPSPPTNTVRGIVKVPYSAGDTGSGVAAAALIVDGMEIASAHESNGGKCLEHPPYRFLVPCPLEVDSSLPFDTTRLKDGPHQVKVEVTDAAGQRSTSFGLTLTVRNVPVNTGLPLVSGGAQVGEQLSASSGKWEGNPTSFTYQWLRCPAELSADGGTSGCVQIAGARGPDYATGPDDVGHRALVRVTAANAAGSASAVSAPSNVIANPPPPLVRPILSRAVLSRKRFRVVLRRPERGRGTVLRLASTESGRLTITVERMRGTSARKIGTLVAPIKAGPSNVLLSGKIGKRRLSRGRYRLTITVQDPLGAVSDPATVRFTVLPG